MPKLPIDLRQSTQWGIASVSSKGVLVVAASTFDLVNVNTGRAHRMTLAGSSLSGPLPVSFSPSSSMSNYSYFSTSRPANFDDFDGIGGRLIGGSGLVYSWCSLTLWDGPAYVSKGLAWVRMSGWGAAIPGAELDHGFTSVIYGDGNPLGAIQTIPQIDLPPEPEHVDPRVHISAKDDSFVVVLQGDVLFDFDKSIVKPEANKPLTDAAAIVKSASRAGSVVLVNGYTDSVGDDTYNIHLSERRAAAVAQWFIAHNYFPASMIRTRGFGKANPVASNADDAGRARNRRVEIFLLNP